MRPLFLLALAGLVSSCSLFDRDKETAVESKTRPQLVGRIASVPSGGGFVLIEAYGPWNVPDGGLLSGVGGEGRTSSLVVTGEKLGRFSAADIRSGVAKVGDPVYFRPIKDGTEPRDSVESPVPRTGGEELEVKTDLAESPPTP